MSKIMQPVTNLTIDGSGQLPEDHVKKLREHYRKALFDDIVPWWEKYSLDQQFGGYLTRLERDGKTYSEDKDMWMTGRQIWMFSHLYNNHENREDWKEIARLGLDFILNLSGS